MSSNNPSEQSELLQRREMCIRSLYRMIDGFERLLSDALTYYASRMPEEAAIMIGDAVGKADNMRGSLDSLVALTGPGLGDDAATSGTDPTSNLPGSEAEHAATVDEVL